MSTICRLQRRPKINSGAVSSAGNKFCEEDIEYRTTVDLTLGAKDLEFYFGGSSTTQEMYVSDASYMYIRYVLYGHQ